MINSLGAPVRAGEACQLADLIFQFAVNRPVDDALRRMLAARVGQRQFESIQQVHWGSLAADPIANATFYLAVDGAGGVPILLHIALSSAPSSGIFAAPVLIGRMRTPRGIEVVVNAIPFTSGDAARIFAFSEHIDRSILPTPQGVETLYIAASHDADTAFAQFRAVQRKYGLSVASWSGPAHEGIWGSIRHGWRHGFAMAGDHETCTRKVFDAAANDCGEAIDAALRVHGRNFDIDLDLTTKSPLPTLPADLKQQLTAFRENGRPVKVAFVNLGLRSDGTYPEGPESMQGWPEEIRSAVEWKAAGKTLMELRQRVELLQETARLFGAVIGIHAPAPVPEDVLEAIGAGAARRLWFECGSAVPSHRILDIAAVLRG